MKWLFLGLVLRRPYVRRPEDGKFDIYDAIHGKRDVHAYGQVESYTMLDIPNRGRATPDPMLDEESSMPTSLRVGGNHDSSRM